MWKNRHVVAALLVAPILAILAWFAVDRFVAEEPHAAEPGRDYPLVAKPNCRRPGGRCELVNEAFRLALEAAGTGPGEFSLVLTSRHPLSAATVGLSPEAGAASEPVAFAPVAADPTRWRGELPAPRGPGAALQLVVSAAGSRYYAEVPAVFLARE